MEAFIRDLLIVIGGLAVFFGILAIACCGISSKCSREEEERWAEEDREKEK